MSAPEDPERLVSSPEVEGAVRSLLGGARDDGATPEQLARIRARLPVSGPADPGKGGGGASAAAGSWLAGGGLVIAAVVGAVLWQGVGSRSAEPAPVVVEAPPVSSLVDSATTTVSEAPSAMVSAEIPSAAASVAGSAVAKAVPKSIPSESALLDAARRELGRQPLVALQFTRRHRTLYPNGVLAQERDVLEVEALARAGRGDAAKAKAEEFQRNHPDSVYGRRVKGAASGAY